MKKIKNKLILLIILAFSLSSCSKKKSKIAMRDRKLTMADTNQVLQLAVDAFDEDFGITFEKQPLRILPNEFIQPSNDLRIKGQPVRFVEVDSSQIDSVFARPLFYLTIFDFRLLTDSTAKVSIVFRDVGDGGRFLLKRSSKDQWEISKKSFFKI